MKNLVNSIIIVFLLLFLSVFQINAQWQPDYRLTNSGSESYLSQNNAHTIAASGDSIHVVFTENRENLTSVFYKRSVDGGISWTPDILISGTLDNLRSASIAVMGQRVHVAWSKIEMGLYEIYYRTSTNGGNDWRPLVNIISNNSINVDNPAIALTGAYVHLTWQSEFSTNQAFISYRNSSNYGVNWGTNQQLTIGDYRGSPSVCASGNNVLIAFQDDMYGNKEISYMRSTNSGGYWVGGLTRLTNDPEVSIHPSAAISGDTVIVTWMDNRYGAYQIFYKKSVNAGAAWLIEHKLTNSSEDCQYPNIAISGTNVHLVWYQAGTGLEIFYLKGIYSGNSWQQITQLTNDPASSMDPAIAASGFGIHVVWVDRRHGNKEIYYKRNPTGNTIGITNISSEIPERFLLHQNYPNPFNPSTNIKFEIPLSKGVSVGRGVFTSLFIYDILGREVRTLVNENLNPGVYEVDFNASDLPSGVYFYQLSSGEFVDTKKVILLK